tara:strand:+ start:2811 stop:3761 length:951 start_codon:yes stop_codon:yes gene_type:complete
MIFETPEFLLLLPFLVALAGISLFWPTRSTALAISSIEIIRGSSLLTWRLRLRWLPTTLRWVVLILIVMALARPQKGLTVSQVPSEGMDIVIAFDVSSSMEVPTNSALGTTRLSQAQRVVDPFIKNLEGNRVGVVIFQSKALALSPLTHDIAAIRRRVENLASGLILDGTAIGDGIGEALVLLEDSPARSRVIVLLTDGQNNAGIISPDQATQLAAALDVRVYTIGFFSGVSPDAIQIDAASLQSIADGTEAKYFNASSPEELVNAYSEIGQLERSRIGERRYVGFREYAPALLLPAVILLLGESALRTTWLRRYP